MSYNTKLDSLNIAATRVAITVKYSSILTGIIVLMLSFNKGGHWIENEVIPPLQLISTYSIVVGTPVGLFLVFFKPLRLVAASLFIILAYTWGISVWVYSLIIAVRMSGLLLLAMSRYLPICGLLAMSLNSVR